MHAPEINGHAGALLRADPDADAACRAAVSMLCMSLSSEFGLAAAHIVTASSSTLEYSRNLTASDLIFLIASLIGCSVTFTANVVGARALWKLAARFGRQVANVGAGCFQRQQARVHASQVHSYEPDAEGALHMRSAGLTCYQTLSIALCKSL